MKRFFLIIFLVTLANNFCFAQKDWANFKKYADDNAALTEQPKIVFMGNSITEFWEKNHPEFFTENNYAGRGISGQVSSQMLVRFRRDVIDLQPKAVVILAGTNDIAQNNGIISLENIMYNIESMCELAKIHKIKVVLCSVLPASKYSWRKELKPAEDIRKLNEMIIEYAADKKIKYIDFYSAMTDEDGGLLEKYSKDGVHPNIDGYMLMENIIQPVLKKIK